MYLPANTVAACAGSTEPTAKVAARIMPVSIAFLPDSTAEWGTIEVAAATTTRPVRVFEAFEGAARSALDAVWVTANMVPGGAHRQ